MAIYNLGTARGKVEIDTNDLKSADLALRNAGQSGVIMGAALVGAFGYVISKGAEFEKQMSFVKAVTGASDDEINKLSESAIELGKKGPFGPTEVAAGMVDLAKAGLSADEIIRGVADASISLAAAGDIPLTQAAETLVNVMRTFNLEAEDATKIVDTLAGAANASTIDVDDLANTFTYAGAPAAQLGVSVEDLATAIAILGNRGIDGSVAGTSLRRIFLQLASPTKQATEQMKELGLITEDGTNKFFTASGQLRPLAEVFDELSASMEGLNDQQKLEALNKIFGARAVNSAAILAGEGAEGFNAINDQIQGISAADVAAERLNNLSGAITLLKAALEATFIEAGSPFQAFLTDLVQILREVVLWFGALPRGLQTFILGSIAVVGILSLMSGLFLLTIGNIIRAIRVFGELGKAFKVIGGVARVAAGGVRLLSAAFLTNPVFLIIAAIIALGVALFVLYKKNEAFRKFVDKLWQDIQKVWDAILDFFRGLPQFFSDLWADITEAFQGAKDGIVDGFKGIAEDVGNAIGAVINFFQELPGKAAEFLGKLPGIVSSAFGLALDAVQEFISELPRRIGFAIGFVLGSIVRWGFELVKLWFNIWQTIITTVIDIGGQIISWAINFGISVFNAIVDFITQLPGRMIDAVVGMFNAVVTWGPQIISAGINLGMSFLQGVIDFILQLPGRILGFLQEAWNIAFSFVGSFFSVAADIGQSIIDGIFSIITGLPGLITGILGDVISAFTGLIGDAFNAAKDFGGGLWDGFKSGLGINSPSFIEEALFDIEDQAALTAGNLARDLRQMQGLSKNIPAINPSVGLTPAALASEAGAAGGGMVVQGPLLAVDRMEATEEEALSMSRRLADETYRQMAAKGKRVVLSAQS